MANEERLVDSANIASRNGTGSAKNILLAQKSERKFICITKARQVPEVNDPKMPDSKVIINPRAEAPKKLTIKPPVFVKKEDSHIKHITQPHKSQQPVKKSVIAVLKERKQPKMIENVTPVAVSSVSKLAKPREQTLQQNSNIQTANEPKSVVHNSKDYSHLRFENWCDEFLAQFRIPTPLSDFDLVVETIVREYSSNEHINSNLARMALGYDRTEQGFFDPTVKKVNVVSLLKESIKIMDDKNTNRVDWRADLEMALRDKDMPWHRVLGMVRDYQQHKNDDYFLPSITNSDNQ